MTFREEYERAKRRWEQTPPWARPQWAPGYSRKYRDLRKRVEEGRRLASERDDLIADGVDPASLAIPLCPPLDDD